MTRIPRFLIGGMLVVAIALTAVSAGCTATGRTGVPAALVGRWKGGSHSNGPWFYEFSTDGEYRAWPERGSGPVNAGTVVVAGDVITFSNGGAPVTWTWSLSGGALVLDGDTYVKA